MLRGPIRLVEVGRTEHNLNRSMNEMCLVERYVDEAGVIHERIWEKIRFDKKVKGVPLSEIKHFYELTFDRKSQPVKRKIAGP